MDHDPADMVELTTSRSEFEAATIAEALQSHRVPAEIVGASHAPARPGTEAHIQVMVRPADLKRATELLQFIRAQSMHLSWAHNSGPAPRDRSNQPIDPGAADRPDSSLPPRQTPAPHAHDTPRAVAHTHGPTPAHGSRTIPIFVAVAVIVVFIVVLLAIVVRPSGT